MSLTATRETNVDGPLKTSEEYAGYRVFDPEGCEVGTVKELFKSADNGLNYVETKIGLLKLQSVLIPVEMVAVDKEIQALLVRENSGLPDYR